MYRIDNSMVDCIVGHRHFQVIDYLQLVCSWAMSDKVVNKCQEEDRQNAAQLEIRKH